MEFPKVLKIAGHDISVEFPYEFLERNDIRGQFYSDMNVIRLSNRNSAGVVYAESQIAACFIHELLHACDVISGHNIFDDNERAIEGISELLFQVFVGSPWVFDFLKREGACTG